MNQSIDQAISIWQAGVEAVKPKRLFASESALVEELSVAERILVVGGGKAGAAMAEALEDHLTPCLDRLQGIINVPNEAVRPLKKIRLHGARPWGSNHPTAAGVAGTREMLQLAESAGPNDVMICLISGGGSALMPAPGAGITLADKQKVTKLLHECGATIEEMNCVRKHLSDFKGGGLARCFRGKSLHSLIISDVIGDPLDVIASGPTSPDPSTFQDALNVLDRHQITQRVPAGILAHLQAGVQGKVPETLKELPSNVSNRILGNNRTALMAAEAKASELGYTVENYGPDCGGDTMELARILSLFVSTYISSIITSLKNKTPLPPPVCLLGGGETTVKLPTAGGGKGGRNQHFVLSCLKNLKQQFLATPILPVTILSGGTDGEDGPTDAAGAVVDLRTIPESGEELQKWLSDVTKALNECDSYSFFDKFGGLLKTGQTDTNVMDVRVILIDGKM